MISNRWFVAVRFALERQVRVIIKFGRTYFGCNSFPGSIEDCFHVVAFRQANYVRAVRQAVVHLFHGRPDAYIRVTVSFGYRFRAAFFAAGFGRFIRKDVKVCAYGQDRSHAITRVHPFFRYRFFVSYQRDGVPLLAFRGEFSRIRVRLSRARCQRYRVAPLSVAKIRYVIVGAVARMAALEVIITLIAVASFNGESRYTTDAVRPVIASGRGDSMGAKLAVFVRIEDDSVMILGITPSFYQVFPI